MTTTLRQSGAKTRAEYRQMGILDPCLCEYCNLGFTAEHPNNGTWRDWHQVCADQAVDEKHALEETNA